MNEINVGEFEISNEKQMKAFAIITAQYVREGVMFKIQKDNVAVKIVLTGGF